MKSVRALITFLSLLFCVGKHSSAQAINRHPDEKQINGSWRWILNQGGVGGFHSTPENMHVEQTLIFRKNQTESLYENDSLDRSISLLHDDTLLIDDFLITDGNHCMYTRIK